MVALVAVGGCGSTTASCPFDAGKQFIDSLEQLPKNCAVPAGVLQVRVPFERPPTGAAALVPGAGCEVVQCICSCEGTCCLNGTCVFPDGGACP